MPGRRERGAEWRGKRDGEAERAGTKCKDANPREEGGREEKGKEGKRKER